MLPLPAFCGLACDDAFSVVLQELVTPKGAAGDGAEGVVIARRLPRVMVRAQALLYIVAGWWCPLHSGGNPSRKGRIYVGLEAYRQWHRESIAAHRMSAKRRQVCARRAQVWQECSMSLAAFLDHLAGQRRGRPYGLLREAANLSRDEAGHVLSGISQLPLRHALRHLRLLLSEAELMARRRVHLLGLAACELAGLPSALLPRVKLEDANGHGEHDSRTLDDLVYLARAGSLPVRALALRSLSDSEDPRAEAILKTSCYEQLPLISAVAEWACRDTTG